VEGVPEEDEGEGAVIRKGFVVSCRRTPALSSNVAGTRHLVKILCKTIIYWRKASVARFRSTRSERTIPRAASSFWLLLFAPHEAFDYTYAGPLFGEAR